MIVLQSIEMDKSHRMDLYRIIDNKFHPGQTPPVTRDEGEVEGIVRIPDVHHDSCVGLLQVFHIEPLHLIIEDPFENQSCLPFGTANRRTPVVSKNFTSIPCPHDTWNAQFPANDGSMAGPATPVGYDASSDLHDGLPIRVCHLGHQYLAFFKLPYFFRAGDDIDWSSADLLADAFSSNQNLTLFLQY